MGLDTANQAVSTYTNITDEIRKNEKHPLEMKKLKHDLKYDDIDKRIKYAAIAKPDLNENEKKIVKTRISHIEKRYEKIGGLHNISLNDLGKIAYNKILLGEDIKDTTKYAINNMAEVEFQKNIFEKNKIEYEKINNTLTNHEGRIGSLEVTVAKQGETLLNHEFRIGHLEKKVDLQSIQINNHEIRIKDLERTTIQQGMILKDHEGRIGNLEGNVNILYKAVNENVEKINYLNGKVNENTNNIRILNQRTNIIKENVNYLNTAVNVLDDNIKETNQKIDIYYGALNNNINYVHGELIKTHDYLDSKINNVYNLNHEENLKTEEILCEKINFVNDKIEENKRTFNNKIDDIKDNIKEVQHNINENNFYFNKRLDDLTNECNRQVSKINDEFRNQEKKIIENEIKINEHEKLLDRLIDSNIKQDEKLKKHEIMLVNQQDNIMLCIDNVKNLYQYANEIKHNIELGEKRINELELKNEKEVNELKNQCKMGMEKVNEITGILNKHTEILTEQSTTIAKIQAITFKNETKIDELCDALFNHESRIKNLEQRMDRIEIILERHEEAIMNLTGDISEMKKQMNEVINRIKKIEEKMERNIIEQKSNSIIELIESMEDDDEQLYEFAKFIIDIRNLKEPFNLDDIKDGLNIIIKKNKEAKKKIRNK